MQTLSRVPKDSISAHREKLLRRYRRSRLTPEQFAAQAGIAVSTLQFWLRQAALTQTDHEPGFLQAPNLLPVAPTPPAYRIQWPGGLSVEVRSGFAGEELAALLEALQSV